MKRYDKLSQNVYIESSNGSWVCSKGEYILYTEWREHREKKRQQYLKDTKKQRKHKKKKEGIPRQVITPINVIYPLEFNKDEFEDSTLYTIYLHRIPDTSEVFYVGMSNSVKRPFDNGATGKRNRFWIRVVEKYGYVVEILHTGLTHDEAVETEKSLIAEYGRRDLNEGTLVNLTDGGEGTHNYVVSEETKKIKSDIYKKKRWRDRPVLQCDLDGNPVNIFLSIADAERETGIRSIYQNVKNKQKTAGGYVFKYVSVVEE